MKYLFAGALAMLMAASCSKKTKMTDTGFRYEFLVDAAGDPVQPGDWLIIDTRVTTSGDTVIYDSRTEQPGGMPIQMPADPANTRRGNLSPLHDVLIMTNVGDSIRLYYPVDSFETPPPSVAAYDVVQYDIKVRAMATPSEYEQMQEAQRQAAPAQPAGAEAEALRQQAGQLAEGLRTLREQYLGGQLDAQITRTASGLGYILTSQGQPGTTATAGSPVKVHFVGMLVENGAVFDNSLTRAKTFDFVLGQGAVIAAWEEAFALLNKGATAILFVPSQLAYGSAGYGNVPANADLMFYVHHVE
ncbi:MAG: FKBP-type peptidyl-prolyl cis-trans isomerase [Saprospiraceae bacterium]|nr:FKBP-type peptidyl-prolyl cis-trans isomerase [Saprospiraceae bacterium]